MEAPKLRFVRCPGCLQLLVEYPTIAVYQCGGCGTILRAKNRVAPAVNANAESGEHNEFSNNSTGGSQNNKLICTDGQKIPPSSDAQPGVLQEKITFASEEKTMSSSNSIDSSEHVNIECSLLDGDASNHDVRTEGINDEDKVTVSNSTLDSVRKVENVETDGNEKGSFTDDGSISNEVATTQRMVHMDGAGSDNNFTEVQSAAEGKCALSDANLDSQEIVAICQPDNISVGAKERVQPYEGFNVESHEDLIEELVRSLSLSDDEEEFVDIAENSELNDALRSQMGSCRFSLGSKMNEGPRTDPHGRSNRFKKIDRLERLRKMDDLRDQLNRLSSQKGLENRYKNKGPGLLQEQISYRHLEQHPCGFDGDSILDSDIIDSYYDQGNPPRYPPPDPFSPTHSHYHCGHGQPHIPYNCSAWEFNSYYQSSYAGSTVLEHESLRSSYKEQKRAVRKSILRSLSGASPFTICNGCFNLVQVPSDIYVSKKKIAKFQCGRCSKALMLSFPATNSEDAKLSNKEVNRKPNKPVHNSVVGMEGGYSFSAECSRGDPVSISEECGASISRSFSGRTRAAVAASGSGKKVSDSALHRLMGYDSASQLLRRSRAFEDGYDSFESMVPVSNRVSRRKNL
uniref:Uncharacterized protein n=1 Tax=Oryza glumipatula TaxID=40148 RepID=A0A0E0BEM6_9ORYZ